MSSDAEIWRTARDLISERGEKRAEQTSHEPPRDISCDAAQPEAIECMCMRRRFVFATESWNEPLSWM